MQRIIRKADRRAQRRLRQVLIAHTYADPTDHRTVLYAQAERLLRNLMGEEHPDLMESMEWRMVNEMGDYTAGLELPDVPLALTPDPGDWFVRPTGTAA
jgi:hypothetical protein